MGVLTGPVAPDPPHATSVTHWPLARRSPNQQLVSALASSELKSRTAAIKRVAQSLGLIVVSWEKTATPLQVRAWFPGGTAVNWGDSGTDNPGTDGWITHTYAAPGVYTVDAPNVGMRAVGEAKIQV